MDSRIHPGMTVVSSDGMAFGRVSRVDADGLVIGGGRLVHGDHRVSTSDISGIFAGEVYLRRRAADVAAMPAGSEDQPPTSI
jgi:hypothetical protein